MEIVSKITDKKTTAFKKLKRSVNRRIKFKRVLDTEQMIREKLGDRYCEIGNQLSHTTINKYYRKLNEKGNIFENALVAKLFELGVQKINVNYPLLNRWFGDIVCGKTVIELDGKTHNDEDRKLKDSRKDFWLNEFGYTVHRFPIKHLGQVDEIANNILNIVGKCEVENRPRQSKFVRREKKKLKLLEKKARHTRKNKINQYEAKRMAIAAQNAGLSKQWLEKARRDSNKEIRIQLEAYNTVVNSNIKNMPIDQARSLVKKTFVVLRKKYEQKKN